MVKEKRIGTFLTVQWLTLHLPMQGVQVQSLVRELRFHMPLGQESKHKHKPYCNKFNKGFKNGPHWEKKKKNFKKEKQRKRRLHESQDRMTAIREG